MSQVFSTNATFMNVARPHKEEVGAPIVMGVPFDLGVTNRSGSRMGPASVRHASTMLCDGDHPQSRVNPILDMGVRDMGDIELPLGYLNDSLDVIQHTAYELALRNCKPMTIGGDHTITLPILRALKENYGEELALIHFDAHLDTWGGDIGHGNFLRYAIEEKLVDPSAVVQIGIRSPVQKEIREWTEAQGVTIFDAHTIHSNPNSLQEIIAKISDVTSNRLSYFTFDIDCIDPSQAPGTGTPEIGGLFTWQILNIINNISPKYVAGCDVVEIAPAYDHAEITSLTGATVMWNFMDMIYRGTFK